MKHLGLHIIGKYVFRPYRIYFKMWYMPKKEKPSGTFKNPAFHFIKTSPHKTIGNCLFECFSFTFKWKSKSVGNYFLWHFFKICRSNTTYYSKWNLSSRMPNENGSSKTWVPSSINHKNASYYIVYMLKETSLSTVNFWESNFPQSQLITPRQIV